MLNSFMKTKRKLSISRSSDEISPMLWYDHWLWMRRDAKVHYAFEQAQAQKGRTGCTSLMHSILCCCSSTFSSQLQVPCKHQRPGEARAAGTGIASKWGFWGARAGSPCQNCCTPGAAKESQSSFVFWPMPSWTVDLEPEKISWIVLAWESILKSLFPISSKVGDWSILTFTRH